MSALDDMLAANAEHAATYRALESRVPSLGLAVVTCLDTRIDPLAAFGLAPGQACVLRNAGGRVTGDLVASLAVAVHLLEVRTVALVQHSGCGLEATEEELTAATGLPGPFGAIDDHDRALEADVERVLAEASLAPLRGVGGYLLDVGTGLLREVRRQERLTG